MNNLLYKILEKTGLIREPVVRQLKLKDTYLVKLDNFGFHLATRTHLYGVKEDLTDIVNSSEPVYLEYSGDVKLIAKQYKDYFNDFQTFKAFKETYNLIKKDLEKK